MRAGSLDRGNPTPQQVIDLYGAPEETWTTFATLRAQLLKNATEDREGERGHTTVATMTLRMYFFASLSLKTGCSKKAGLRSPRSAS